MIKKTDDDKSKFMQEIGEIYVNLRLFFEVLCPNESYDDLHGKIKKSVDDGLTAHEMSMQRWLEYLARMGDGFELTPIVLASAFCIESHAEFNSGDRKKALGLLEHAKFYLPDAEIESNIENRQKKKERREDIGRKGGEGAAKNLQPVINEIIKLLRSECPKGGWLNKKVAAHAIEKSVACFVNDGKYSLADVTHSSTLYKWLSSKSDIKVVMDSLLIKNYQ